MRCSLPNFAMLFGFIWFLVLVFFYSSSMQDFRLEDEDRQNAQRFEQPADYQSQFQVPFPESSDENPNIRNMIMKVLKRPQKSNRPERSFRLKNTKEPFIWPKLPDEVISLHHFLNLTNPGGQKIRK
jgi:hypothetical protein